VEIHPTIGPKIRAWRTIRGLSLRDLADRTALDHAEIGRFERRERNPPYPAACAIARALELPIEILCYHSPAPARWTRIEVRRARRAKRSAEA